MNFYQGYDLQINKCLIKTGINIYHIDIYRDKILGIIFLIFFLWKKMNLKLSVFETVFFHYKKRKWTRILPKILKNKNDFHFSFRFSGR